MTIHSPDFTTRTSDEVLLDVATIIELNPRDRRIAENRYRRLKTHLERDASPLAPYLVDGQSLIYAHGSIATSTAIVSGTEDDRFDVDAIIEFDVPKDWTDQEALDLLERALQGFPGVVQIVRCTRCVQLQFAFMHMDVTVLDRRARIPVDRAGEIFHSPDDAPAYRVLSNPWGFTDWFRSKIGSGQDDFVEMLQRKREAIQNGRLRYLDEAERIAVARADQVDLPPAIPNAIDAQEAVALKLLKRYLNLRYEDLELKRPPSIYLTKRAGDLGYHPRGLTFQLSGLAHSIATAMRDHLAAGTRPAEVNPSYPPDEINDRWPADGAHGHRDLRALAEALEYLIERLETMAETQLADIARIIDELFGERIGKQHRRILAERYDRRSTASPILTEPRTGSVFAPAMVISREGLKEVPKHHFHLITMGFDDDGES